MGWRAEERTPRHSGSAAEGRESGSTAARWSSGGMGLGTAVFLPRFLPPRSRGVAIFGGGGKFFVPRFSALGVMLALGWAYGDDESRIALLTNMATPTLPLRLGNRFAHVSKARYNRRFHARLR